MKQCFLDMTERIAELEPTAIVVAFTRSSQTAFQDGSRRNTQPWPLAEELLTVDGYQAGEGHFSLGL